MEKKKTPPFGWILLTALSISCYVYLHAASVEQFGSCPSALYQNMGERDKEAKVILPDVAFVKKILNITKIVMPSE